MLSIRPGKGEPRDRLDARGYSSERGWRREAARQAFQVAGDGPRCAVGATTWTPTSKPFRVLPTGGTATGMSSVPMPPSQYAPSTYPAGGAVDIDGARQLALGVVREGDVTWTRTSRRLAAASPGTRRPRNESPSPGVRRRWCSETLSDVRRHP
jgi:hypothetical protein